MNESTLSVLWWEGGSDSDVHESVKTDFDTLRIQNPRQDRFSTYEKVYRNEDITESLALEAELNSLGSELTEYSRSSHNLVAQVVDNIVSRIVRTKPRSIYSVHGGNWSLRRNARMQQKWVDYIAQAKFFRRLARTQVLHGCLLGVGHTKIYRRHGYNDVACMHIHPSDIFVDQTEATFGVVKRLFHRQFLSRDVVRKLFSGHEATVDASGIMSEGDFRQRGDTHQAGSPILDQVEVCEAWHLPSFPGAGDGRHVCFTDEGLLFNKPWEREDFPVMSFQWKERPGDFFHGISVTEEILGIHLDMNFTLQQVHEGIEVSGSPTWLTPQAANVSRDELTDLPGQVVEFTGAVPPTLVQYNQVATDMVGYAQAQEARAYRRLGLDSSTPNQPSAGLETGRAVRMDFDARSMAFVTALQNWENLYEDFAYKALAAGKECWEHDNSYSVVVPRNKWTIQDVPWKDVEIDDRSKYTLRVQVGSQLSQHPAGRIDDVQNLINSGAVTDQAEKRALMDLADLDSSNSKATAALDAIEFMCEEMLDEGVEHFPEPYDDLDLCMSTASAEYLKARTSGAPEDRLNLMRQFLDRCSSLVQKRDIKRAAQEAGIMQPGATPPAPDAQGQNPSAITGGIPQ